MGTPSLPHGTLIKHGTRVSRLQAILKGGITPHVNPESPRSKIEPASLATEGVYCGIFTAYFGAYAAFAEYAHEVVPIPGRPLRPFVLDYPIVLNIRLGQEVEILADEDFLPALLPTVPENEVFSVERMRDQAMQCWDSYRSCVLPPVPPSWITEVEFLNLLDLCNPDPLARERFSCDLHTLACGVVQSQRRWTYEDALRFWRSWINYDAAMPTLSVQVKADENGLKAIASHPMNRSGNLEIAKASVLEAYKQLSMLSPKLGIKTYTG